PRARPRLPPRGDRHHGGRRAARDPSELRAGARARGQPGARAGPHHRRGNPGQPGAGAPGGLRGDDRRVELDGSPAGRAAPARRGWGRVHRNAMVGAVVLAQGGSAGERYPAEYGGEHAERAGLAAAGERARGATLVATLEPCAHTGKQPPCVEAILAAGVRRVVAAAGDPNPEAGGGAGRLRSAGVEVELGLLEREARLQNAAFFHLYRTPSRPWVALKLATSPDC